MYVIYVCARVSWCTCGGQGTTCRGQFFLSTMWVLGIELRSSGMVASPFALGAISLAILCVLRTGQGWMYWRKGSVFW